MNKEFALVFLKNHQPMPNDDELTPEIIETYGDVMDYIRENPDKEFLPLVLNSFGEYEGLGIYSMADEVINKYDRESVVVNLVQSLRNTDSGVKYRCVNLCKKYSDERLIYPLAALLDDEVPSIRLGAVKALSMIDDGEIKDLLCNYLEIEEDESNKAFVESMVRGM